MTGYRSTAAMAGLAALWAWSSPVALACFACGGNAGDFTALSIITWQMESLHSALTSQMQLAQDGLSQGSLNGALASILGLGFLYGGLHALGPGHGKIALGAHAAAAGESWRNYAAASAIASVGHVASAGLAVTLVLAVFQGVLSEAEMMQRVTLAVSGLGLLIVGAMLLITGGHLHLHWGAWRHQRLSPVTHSHVHDVTLGHDHGPAHSHSAAPSKGLLAVALASAMTPCTSSMLVLMYGVAHGYVWLAMIVVACIAAGQAIIQTGVAFAGLSLRRMIVASFGGVVLRSVAAASGIMIFVVGLAALHASIS